MRCVFTVVVAWLAACSPSRCPEVESPQPAQEEQKVVDERPRDTDNRLAVPRFYACCDRVGAGGEGVGCIEVEDPSDCTRVQAMCEAGSEPPKCTILARIIHPDSIVRLCCASMEPTEDGGTRLADCEELDKDDGIRSCTDRQRVFITCKNPMCDPKGCTCTS